MAELTKECLARIRVKLSEDILPVPALSRDELHAYLVEHLSIDDPDSPIVSLSVGDPSDRSPRRRY